MAGWEPAAVGCGLTLPGGALSVYSCRVAERPARRIRYVLWLWLSTALGIFPGWAGPWFHRDWQTEDGLPGDDVAEVVQTQDGFLWIATQSGLARFDGLRFQSVNLPLGRGRPILRAMLLDDAGRLWLGEEGGVIATLLGGPPRLLTSTNGLSRAQPLEMVQDATGAIWVASADGSVSRVEGETVRRFGVEEGLPAAGTCCLARDAQKRIWFAKAGQVGLVGEGKFRTLLTLPERFIHLGARRRGGVWVCAGDRLLQLEPHGAHREVAILPPDTTPVRPTRLLEDSHEAVWVGTSAGGLFRCEGSQVARIETSHRRIRTITEDREGNIWVGTDGGGLNRLRRLVVELEGKDAGLPFDTVRSVCEDAAGTYWVVTQNGELANKAGGNWTTVSSTPAWSGGQATSVACDRSGAVWVGTFSHGLFRWAENRFVALRRQDGLAQASVRSLLADSRGGLWIAFSQGDVLQRLSQGRFESFALAPSSRPIRAMTEDAFGSIWLANLDMRLLRVVGDTVVDETARTSEPLHPIRCLAATPDGALWIGYSASGLGRLKGGKFVKLGAEEGLRDESICSLVPDTYGEMWFGSDHGIFRASVAELLAANPGRAGAVRCIGYGRDEGLPSLQGYYGYAPGACRSHDGRILIPTHSGLAVVHPDRIHHNAVPPTVTIERVELDNRVVEPGSGKLAFQVPPGHRRLEFVFTAPSFIEPEKVRFRYQLQGWDEGWVEAGSKRSAVYSRLPDGRYCLRVIACNSDEVWSPTGAQLAFIVRPFVWNTWWFRTVSGILLLGLVFAGVRYVAVRRLRSKVRRLVKENAVERERVRIAQDIHDDLGACMTQISLLTELARQALPQPATAGEHVEQIATLSREGIKALDEIVWAVNPRNDSLGDLLDYVGQYAVTFLQAAAVRCHVDFPDEPPPGEISGELRHGLFLAVKETLTNVVKHSGATEVSLRVRVGEQQLCWETTDNGRGFETAPDNALADGLRNLRKRLAALAGTCEITSEAGRGTTVRLVVPWNAQAED